MIDKDYILENNLMERYVLGELDNAEQNNLESALIQFPEFKAQFDIIEEDFEKLGRENAVKAPIEVRKGLIENVISGNGERQKFSSKNKTPRFLWIAASIVGLLLIGNIYLYTERQNSLQNLELVEQEKSELNQQLDAVNDSLNLVKSRYALIGNPQTEKYLLKGNNLQPDATIIAYINDAEKKVLVDTKQLPELDKEHDYQMWADVNGEMIDMGVLISNQDLIAVNYIDNAASINITIEPAGGSDHATVANLLTNAYLN